MTPGYYSFLVCTVFTNGSNCVKIFTFVQVSQCFLTLQLNGRSWCTQSVHIPNGGQHGKAVDTTRYDITHFSCTSNSVDLPASSCGAQINTCMSTQILHTHMHTRTHTHGAVKFSQSLLHCRQVHSTPSTTSYNTTIANQYTSLFMT